MSMATHDVRSMHIAVLALSLLGGSHKKCHTEEIAQKCFELAPSRFKWQRFDYPDKELVRKALFHASEDKNGALVSGRSGIDQRRKARDGWSLTEAGAQWARDNEDALRGLSVESHSAMPKRDADRFLNHMRRQEPYRRFLATNTTAELSQYAFTDLLSCSPDAPRDVIRTKFDRMKAVASIVNDRQVLAFLRSCEATFAMLLGRSNSSKGEDSK